MAAFHLFLSACRYNGNSNAVVGSPQQQENIEATNAILNSFAVGDAEGIKDNVADNFIDHTENGDKKGMELFADSVRVLYDVVANFKLKVIRQGAKDNYVYSLVQYQGKRFGLDPTPVPYNEQVLEIAKFTHRKAVEHWVFKSLLK